MGRASEDFVPQVAGEWTAGTHMTWAVRESGPLAGVIGLYRLDGKGTGELGSWVARPARGRGIVTEASRAVLDWGFATEGLDLARIEWMAVVGNTASAHAARALGFRYEGLRRQGLVSRGRRSDGWMAALLRTDDHTPLSARRGRMIPCPRCPRCRDSSSSCAGASRGSPSPACRWRTSPR
ncbi:MAG: GNAT family N-acetyltransferase [Microbacterium sp.]|uniref:GNAT family N-acetyltransferase n=1 Tax=Microbacterium sp. TaxID=51671 RepID=UPI003A84ACB9